MKLILVTNIMHMCTQAISKNTYMMKPHSLVLRFSQKQSTNVMKTAHIMPHNIKTLLYNIKKVLIFSPENRPPILITHITVPDVPRSLTPYTMQISAMDMFFHKSHKSTTNKKNTNYIENKIGLAQYTLMSKSMLNSIT